jgi:hypothetical protein
MAWRASLLQATWNYERQQGVGWAWALAPALERLEPDASSRARRLAEHTAYFNTQPTPRLARLGTVAALEEERAAGQGPDTDAMARVKSVLGSALARSAIDCFWLTLRPFAACLGIVVAITIGPLTGAPGDVARLQRGSPAAAIRRRGLGLSRRTQSARPTAPAPRGTDPPALHRRVGAGRRAGGGAAPRRAASRVRSATRSRWRLGLTFGLLTAQRSRPSPTGWALIAGAASMIGVWTH